MVMQLNTFNTHASCGTYKPQVIQHVLVRYDPGTIQLFPGDITSSEAFLASDQAVTTCSLARNMTDTHCV